MNPIRQEKDIAELIENTQNLIRNNQVSSISKENNLAFLTLVGRSLTSGLESSDDGSSGLSAEDVINRVSMIIDDIIDDNPIERACERLGIRYRQVYGVSKTFMIPEIDGETVFISGVTENDDDPEIKNEKDTCELLIESKKLWSKRIMKALNGKKDNRLISVDDDIMSVFFRKGIKNRTSKRDIADEPQMELEHMVSEDTMSDTEGFYDLEKSEDLIPMWKRWLEDSCEALQKAGLKQKDGKLDFDDFEQDHDLWPDIGGVRLIYYPDCRFNRENGIGNANGKILKVSGLISMFRRLGFEVKDNKEENSKKSESKPEFTEDEIGKLSAWKRQIEDIRAELEEETGLIIEDNVMYFCDINGYSAKSWHKKSFPSLGKKLRSFPNQAFNRKFLIGNHRGEILNEEDLKKMFGMLGFKIASDDEELIMIQKKLLPKWRKQIEGSRIILQKKAGIIMSGGIWYFCNCTGYGFWPEIGGKGLSSFPNCSFNIANKIGNAAGQIKNKEDIKDLFVKLGFECATEKQEKQMELRLLKKQYPKWRKQILEAKKELEDVAGIIEKDGIWHFCRCRSKNNWPKVGGKNLAYFTNDLFRKTHGIGVEKRQFEYKEEIKALFEKLGFKVADNSQELLMLKLISQKKRCR